MPHADASFIPSSITTKEEFWEHIYTQLDALVSGQRSWISNLANASSLIYTSLLGFPPYFGRGDRTVNWCGFYVDSSLFPQPIHLRLGERPATPQLLLGPFCGKPACQFIDTAPDTARGVCADAFLQRKTLLVPDVDAYPGHIACDGETKSEIVCPLIIQKDGRDIPVGVLDLDCVALSGFNEADKVGLEKIAQLVAVSCDW